LQAVYFPWIGLLAAAIENHDGQICTYWRERYSDDELFLKAGILTGLLPD